MLLPVFMVIAFRDFSIGSDTMNYVRFYDLISAGGYSPDFLRYERGYQLYVRLLIFLGFGSRGFLIITAAICLTLLGFFIRRYSKNPPLVILLYLSFGLFSFEMSGIRQSLAMSICLLAIPFIEKRKLIPFLLVVLLAIMFHNSAFIFLFAYFVSLIPPRADWLTLEFLLLGVIVYFGDEIMLSAGEFFSLEYGIEADESGGIFVFFMVCFTILGLVLSRALQANDENNKIFIGFTIICTVLWIMRLSSRTAERPSMYYMFSVCLLLGNIAQLKSKEPVVRVLVNAAILLIAAIFFYRRVCLLPPLTPYHFFW